MHEVTPRDGLQNEGVVVALEDKVSLVRHLIETNPSSIELTSFVRPDVIPAMADGAELCLRLNDSDFARSARNQGMGFAALVPNMRGYETFKKVADDEGLLDTVVVLVSATESHSQANVRSSKADALKAACDIIDQAKRDGRKVQAYISLAFGCPFEGEVDPLAVQEIVDTYVDKGADIIMLADTLGVGTPEHVELLVQNAAKSIPVNRIGLHLHDTKGRAQINAYAGAKNGVRRFDSATGGTGGCNFAPGAKGNISTQALLAVLDHLGIEHGMDRKKLNETNSFLEATLRKKLESEKKFEL